MKRPIQELHTESMIELSMIILVGLTIISGGLIFNNLFNHRPSIALICLAAFGGGILAIKLLMAYDSVIRLHKED